HGGHGDHPLQAPPGRGLRAGEGRATALRRREVAARRRPDRLHGVPPGQDGSARAASAVRRDPSPTILWTVRGSSESLLRKVREKTTPNGRRSKRGKELGLSPGILSFS